MDRLQDIIRFLTAAGGTPSRDGNSTHFTYEDQGSIRMRTWTGFELNDDQLIADEVRPGTSAPIVNRSHKRIFVVHKDNSIRCFTDPLGDGDQVEEDEIDDDAPWNEEEIAGVDTRVHPQSQLAISYDRNTIFVFYQKPDGSLGCINEYNSQWKEVKLPAVAALDGTPLATCNTNYAVFLFYISTDGTVRYLENREGKWNDVFFSAAKIIDPKAQLPGSAFRLTVAEDRQPFERIRPLVFCLDNKDLSIIKFRSKRLDTIGKVEGTEFVPCLGNKERNKYYFWSPYPFYTMIKRRGKNIAQATISKGLWHQRSTPQQEYGNSSAMKNLNRHQESFVDNRSTPVANNNKTPATRGLDTTNAQATFPPQNSEQREIPSSIPAQSTIFAGFGRFTDPLNAIKRRIFGTRQNEDATEEDTSENIDSNYVDIADILPQADESQMNQMEVVAIGSTGLETNTSETKEAGPKEAEHEELENDENNIQGTEAEMALVIADRPEYRLEEADSEGTEEEAGSEGTHSEAAETAPSEVEVEIEENQSPKIQAEKAQNEEVEEEESEDEEPEDEEVEDEEVEDEDVEDEEDQHEEMQIEEVQPGEFQPGEGQTRNIQAEEAQIESPRTDDAPTNDAKPEEYEAKVSKIGAAEPKEQEQQNVKWEDSESESASEKDELPTTKSSATKFTLRPPATEPSATQESSQEADVVDSALRYLDPEASKHTEGPSVDKEKGPATTDAPISNGSRFSTPQDIQEDMNEYIENANLRLFFPKESTYVPKVADKAFEFQNNEENLLNRGADIQGITRLGLYQPVLYCDDSTSMKASSRVSGQKERTRVNDQQDMVRRVTRISTSVVPSGYGTSLQFINFVRDIHDNKLNLLQVEAIMNSVKPKGHTEIGTNLKKKILKPLVYDVIKNNKRLERPILVSCITDGCPSDKDPKAFKKEILKCIEFLKNHGYPPSTIRFQISQIGNSRRADEFLQELKDDKELDKVVYCTAQRLDEQFNDLRHNEKLLEQWLLRTLLEPIMGEGISNLNL